MNPISTGLGIAGFGLKLLGGIMGSSAAEDLYRAQEGIRQQQVRGNDEKYKAMLLASRRQQLEIIRNGQRARAMALNAAVNQGAQLGTGLQGGLSQISNDMGLNLLGNMQSAETGKKMYDINNTISQFNLQASQAQTDLSQAQGFASLGNSFIQAGPTIGNLFKGIF